MTPQGQRPSGRVRGQPGLTGAGTLSQVQGVTGTECLSGTTGKTGIVGGGPRPQASCAPLAGRWSRPPTGEQPPGTPIQALVGPPPSSARCPQDTELLTRVQSSEQQSLGLKTVGAEFRSNSGSHLGLSCVSARGPDYGGGGRPWLMSGP